MTTFGPLRPLRGSVVSPGDSSGAALLLLHQPPLADRARHLLRFLPVPAAVLEPDGGVERLAGALDHGGAILGTPRSRHHLVGVERLLHLPAWAELRPEVSAAVQLHGQAGLLEFESQTPP